MIHTAAVKETHTQAATAGRHSGPGGFTMLFGHMYGSSVRVSVGKRIRRGRVIAENDGTSTGSCIHLQNPIHYLQGSAP